MLTAHDYETRGRVLGIDFSRPSAGGCEYVASSSGNGSPRWFAFKPSDVLPDILSDKFCQKVFAFMASRGTVGGGTRGPKTFG